MLTVNFLYISNEVVVLVANTMDASNSRLPILESILLSNKNKSLDNSNTIITDQDKILRDLANESIDYSFSQYTRIYSDLSTEKAKLILKESKEAIMENSPSPFTYGEIEFFSFINIIQRCQPSHGQMFTDLGIISNNKRNYYYHYYYYTDYCYYYYYYYYYYYA